jgi:hypothetical protein
VKRKKVDFGIRPTDKIGKFFYQQECENCISATWKPQSKGKTGSHWELMMSITSVKMTI